MKFTLPIIVISTITGTANFAQDTFPDSWRTFVPLGIGGLNLIAAIATTVLQFIKANELMEAHRVASVAYGKLSRDIKLDLGLPVLDRKSGGADLINRCSSDYDRLIEQSPPIPGDILDLFNKQFKNSNDFDKPEITNIQPINLFDQLAETKVLKNVKNMFSKKVESKRSSSLTGTQQPPTFKNLFSQITTSIPQKIENDDKKKAQKRIATELEMLKSKNLVSVRQLQSPESDNSDTENNTENDTENIEIVVVPDEDDVDEQSEQTTPTPEVDEQSEKITPTPEVEEKNV